ncbi:MAG: hypothetical protein KC572_08830 [Gammaproteobacteria bacterium]|nr:hypothetical protein [Gammaproteobacteria bacterium]
MNCTEFSEQVTALTAGTMPEGNRDEYLAHAKVCAGCSAALRGRHATLLVEMLPLEEPPAGSFERIATNVTRSRPQRGTSRSFWSGAAFGGAVAASLLAIVLMLGVFQPPADPAQTVAEFYVSAEEPRMMHVAIEVDRALPGAEISILLTGNVEVQGFGSRRELNWSDDLDAGVNKLSLPLVASGEGGGQMVVRLSHPDSEQLFVIDLPLDSEVS